MASAKTVASAPLLYSRMVSKSPVFYGWVILVVATLASVMTTPGQTFGVSVFIEHFIKDLGLSRSWVSTLYAAGTVLGGFSLYFVGRLFDRYGPRVMMVITAFLLGLTCVYMSFVSGWVMLLIGFTLLRMLAQGSMSLVSTTTINLWWVQWRGLILGLSGVVISLFGMGAGPNLLAWMIERFGWRTSYVLMGLVLIGLMAPLGYLFFRGQPERYGLLPDGRKSSRKSELKPELFGENGEEIKPAAEEGTMVRRLEKLLGHKEVSEENWTLSEAMRTSVFWVFLLGLASIAMLGTGLTFHIVSIFADNGLSAQLAAAAYVPVAFAMAIANLVSGILMERIRLRVLMALALLCQAAALWLVPYLGVVALMTLFGLVTGASFGLMRTVSTVAWARYYGRQFLGSIAGFASTVSVFSSALGPVSMGVARDQLGSYNTTLMAMSILPLVLAVACMFVDRPQKVVGER